MLTQDIGVYAITAGRRAQQRRNKRPLILLFPFYKKIKHEFRYIFDTSLGSELNFLRKSLDSKRLLRCSSVKNGYCVKLNIKHCRVH